MPLQPGAHDGAASVSQNNNSKGANQHRTSSILLQHPELPQLVQQYINEGTPVKEIPGSLQDDHGISISLRSLSRLKKEHGIATSRTSNATDVEKGEAILAVTEQDPLNTWGSRKVKEKLAHRGVHIPRDFISQFRRYHNPEGSVARHPVTRKIHRRGLWSAGPNEEWGGDGHEKLTKTMGITIYGIVDKFSRKELAFFAVPAEYGRNGDMPLAVYLLTVKEFGVSDKGTETSKLAAVQEALRQEFMPDLPSDTLPPHVFVKSIYNITRERAWRPLWAQDLANILFRYETGKADAGFQPNNVLHQGVAYWLWGKIVQEHLDVVVMEKNTHRIRRQRKVTMPTGGRPDDFYYKPHMWHGTDLLIRIPTETVDRLIAEHVHPELFHFGTDEIVALSESLYKHLGYPETNLNNGWAIFCSMIDTYQATYNA